MRVVRTGGDGGKLLQNGGGDVPFAFDSVGFALDLEAVRFGIGRRFWKASLAAFQRHARDNTPPRAVATGYQQWQDTYNPRTHLLGFAPEVFVPFNRPVVLALADVELHAYKRARPDVLPVMYWPACRRPAGERRSRAGRRTGRGGHVGMCCPHALPGSAHAFRQLSNTAVRSVTRKIPTGIACEWISHGRQNRRTQ